MNTNTIQSLLASVLLFIVIFGYSTVASADDFASVTFAKVVWGMTGGKEKGFPGSDAT